VLGARATALRDARCSGDEFGMSRTASSVRMVALCGLLGCGLLGWGAGCAVEGPKSAPDDIEVLDGDVPSDGYTRRLSLRGPIAFGETIESDFAAVGYAGWVFTGAAGSLAVIDAHGATEDADTVVTVYGPLRRSSWTRARRVAFNDDHGGTLDSHLEVELDRDGTYLIIVRDYSDAPGSFTLSLGCGSDECRAECGADGSADECPAGAACQRIVCVRAPCPSYCAPIDPVTACETDADCVAVPTTCCSCSMGGHERAVNASYADEVAPVCGDEPARCRAVYLCDDDQPACVDSRCEMVPSMPAEPEDPTGRSCGGRTVDGPRECPEGFFCAYEASAICGYADAPGTCQRRPEACITLFDPVCGCDGRTYSNACSAASHGQSVQHDGECPGVDDPSCGGLLGQACAEGEFC
jgi:hypothetical protein